MIQHTLPPPVQPPPLLQVEKLYHRDQLRAARYAALADAEGFSDICFALEALGMRLLGHKATLGQYRHRIAKLAEDSVVLHELPKTFSQYFTQFSALYSAVNKARNDAMHTGVYARNVTSSAVELCIGLEESLMKEEGATQMKVKDLVVKSPVSIEPWQPVAYARQLMLTHSFSFLPVFHREHWELLSELALAKYLKGPGVWRELLAATIEHAVNSGLKLTSAKVVGLDDEVASLLAEADDSVVPTLWLVEDERRALAGVLSPFELM